MIHLYVEHLINIRTLSLQASLPTFSGKDTEATLSADGSLLSLTHEGETASIRLPINFSPNQQSTAIFTIPAVPSKELSFRIQLEAKKDQPNGNGILHGGQINDDNIIPWTADALTAETEIRCKACDTSLVRGSQIRAWKDLPSEGWAEMMEFWHCHKPDEPHDHDNSNLTSKGYSAGSQLALKRGVAMVDPLDFLLMPEDCANIEARPSIIDSNDQESPLQCTECHYTLGHMEATTGGFRLRKLNLSVSPNNSGGFSSYDKQKWLACLLLCAMDTRGVRKFSVRHQDMAFKLWLFTPDLTVSSSASKSPEPMRATKVLWQDIDASDDTGPELLTAASLTEDELRLTKDEAQILRRLLEDSAGMLPPGARTFQDKWNVGLLERFTANDMDVP